MSDFLPYIMLAGLVSVYALSYVLNKRTPIPEDCKDLIDEATCNACNNFTCSHKGS